VKTGVEELLQHARGEERGVNVSVTRWAPFEGGVRGPADRGQVIYADLGFGILEEVKGEAVNREVWIGG